MGGVGGVVVVVEGSEAEAEDAGGVVEIVAVGLAGGGFGELLLGHTGVGGLLEHFVLGDGGRGKYAPPVQGRPAHGELGRVVWLGTEHGRGGRGHVLMQYIIAMFFGRVSVPRLVCIAMEALGNPVDTLISVTVVADPVDLPP